MTFISVLARRSPRPVASRVASLLAPVALAAALVGCSTVSSTSDAFSVNGKGYAKNDFNELVTALIDSGQVQLPQGSKEISAADARGILSQLILHEATVQYVEKAGVAEDPAFRTQLEDQASKDQAFQSYPASVQELLIEMNVARNTLSKVTAPSESAVQKLYDAKPSSAGVLCLSHILVKTESDARKVLARLDKGEKFAEVAKDASTEPGAAQSGGALKNGDEDCQSLAELQKGFDPDFMAGAVEAKPGVPTGPVKSQFGYHVILSHSFDDVKDSVMRVISAGPGAALLQGFLSVAKVSVDSTYGRWNGATATVG